jgi:adenosylcobinamide-phosphate synthase
MGAVLYRMSAFCARYWAYKSRVLGAPTNERLALRSQQAFAVIDHVPTRLTAAGFAVVGNFEDAVDCWRRHAGLWQHGNDGVLLAAAAGAVGLSLGGPAAGGNGQPAETARTLEAGAEQVIAEGSTPGATPQFPHLRSVVGLVWRSVVLWMLLLALMSLANLLG